MDSSPPPHPHTYQVPKQEDDDAHHQRAQPEETQVPVALPAETSRSGTSARVSAPLLTKPGVLPPPGAPPSSPPPCRPRLPLADGRDHGEVEPVVDDAIPVTDHDAVCRAQVGLALPVGETGIIQGGDKRLPAPPPQRTPRLLRACPGCEGLLVCESLRQGAVVPLGRRPP